MPIVFSRSAGESIIIGKDIMVTIHDIRGDKVRLELHVPKEIPVHRSEVYMAIVGMAGAEGIDSAHALTPEITAALEERRGRGRTGKKRTGRGD